MYIYIYIYNSIDNSILLLFIIEKITDAQQAIEKLIKTTKCLINY